MVQDIIIIIILLVEVPSKRWKVLRERYTEEHKKAKKPTGTGTDEVEKVLEFYHLMDFLQDFVKHRRYIYRVFLSYLISF